MATRFMTMVMAVLLSVICAGAQTISVGIVYPAPDQYIDGAASKSIVTKLQRVLAKNGVADTGSDFVLVPSVTVEEDELIESGMVNLFKIQGTLNLALTQLSTGKTFGATAVAIKGSGKRSKAAAVKAAVGSINVNNPELHQFLENSKQNVVDYYNKNSASIMGKARTAASQGNYDEALAILASFPEGMPMEKTINDEITKVYKQYINANCQATIIQARGALSTKNYDLANALLSEIDPNSSCYQEAIALTKTIGNEVRQAEAQERADQQRREDKAVELQKARINAVRDVAKAYYQRTYPSYTVVFR